MIALLFAATTLARPPVVIVPDLDAEAVTIQALVRLPRLSDAERVCALVAWDAMLDGSEEYTGAILRGWGQQTGRSVVATALGDHLYLRISMPKNQLGIGASMLESLLRRPLLNDEDLNRALAKRLKGPMEPWPAALDPETWREAKPNRTEILGTFRRLVRPENIVLALGGDVDPAAASKEFARFDDWAPAASRSFVREWASAARPLLQSPNRVTTFELTGPESVSGLATLPQELLTAVALGVGKGSAIQRVAREANGWSYRQEGFLQPTAGGLRLRLILARQAATDDPAAFLGVLREALKKDAQSWTEADRTRAIGLLKAWLEDGIGICPIRLLPEGRPMASVEERTHLRAWWRLKFGAELAEAELLKQAGQVKLDDLKASALATLENSGGRFLVGRP